MGDPIAVIPRRSVAVIKKMESKDSRARVAFVLLSALAICCSVMYITADGDMETENILKSSNKNIGAGFDVRHPKSIESVDVKKAGMIVTNTPDGRMRLLKYLSKVEKQIAKESAGRRADIAAIRAHMARNFAFNQAARASMKKALLAKMAINAKAAKDSLDRNMRRVQRQFAAHAELENKRNKATIARSRKTREIMRKNKRQAASNLKLAVLNQQRALSALASATNAKIHQTNKHIAANAAQIKENAKKARKDLEKAMNRFDHKMANVRHHADMALKAASSRMDAALSANKALQDKRFAKTVKDIADAKKEADARVAAARSEFKVGLLHLGATVRHQVSKLNSH